MKNRWIILFLAALLFVVVISLALADGTESLGPPSIPISVESSNGLIAAGTGMFTQPGTINVSVPDDAAVQQVLLYWEGKMEKVDDPGDDTIVIDGTEVTGQLIGGPTIDYPKAFSSAYRADITDLELVGSGDTLLTLEGLDFTHLNDGAGVLVLYKDDRADAYIELFDGLDLAFQGWDELERRTTDPATFTFAASAVERTAQLSLFVASVDGSAGGPRPNSIEVTTGGGTEVFSDRLQNADDNEWDTLDLAVTVPAGADSLTVQLFSRDDFDTGNLPASLNWIVAGLLVGDTGVRNSLEVSKECTPEVFAGDEIVYEITVSNTGEQDLTGVEVDDSLLGTVAIIDSLAVAESQTFTETLIAPGPGVLTNTVFATGTAASSPEPVESNTADCETTVHELEVTKDAQTSLVRRYNWEIDKTVEGEKSINYTLFPTQVVSPTYEVVVGLGSPPYSDGNWAVSGTIRITNPAQSITANLNRVRDVISDIYMFHQYFPLIFKDGIAQNAAAEKNQHSNNAPPGISAAVDCPSLIIPPGETLVCTYGPVDLSTGHPRTNTAFAELNNTVGGVISGTTVFSGTAQIEFADAAVELIDKEVTVSDNRQGSLGTANVDEDALPKSFGYDRVMPSFSVEECMDGGKEVQNTATFITNESGSTGDSSANVNLFCIFSASTAFEDLPLDPVLNDWDYNDAFFEVRFNDPYPDFSPSNDLESITFSFLQPVRLAEFRHAFHIQPNVFRCDGTYSLTRNGVAVATNEPYQSGLDIMIFEDTANPPNTAELVINFDVPAPGACPLDLSDYDPFLELHGEGLFYRPYLVVKTPLEKPEDWYTIKPSSDNGQPDPRLVSVPELWQWPAKDGQEIWSVYPDVDPPDPPGQPYPTFHPFWWVNYQP